MNYIIDSSLWIDYLSGGKTGARINEIIEGNNEIYVISLIIAEVVSKVKRAKRNIELAYESIIKNAKVIEIKPRVAKEAGLLHAIMKEKFGSFPLIDTIIICSAQVLKAKILTKDAHFKSFKEAVVL